MYRPLLISLCLTSTALATTWTVDDDGAADFNTIQEAINFAIDGDEIVVMPGTYTGPGGEGVVVDMVGKAVWLHSSDGPEVTSIDGETLSHGIRCGSGETGKTIIDGFSVTNGLGGGVSCGVGSSIIANCRIFGNGMSDYPYSPTGGGIYVNFYSNATIVNCDVFDNHVSGYCSPPPGLGGAYGGGIYVNHYSNVTIENCRIFDNSVINGCGYGGGLYIASINNVSLLNSTICGNSNNGVPDQIVGEYNNGGGNTIEDVCPNDCPDINGDGYVDVLDLLFVISDWNTCTGNCPGDVNDDGTVDINDLLIVVAAWGPCE
jgi:hypothetical protein